MIYSDVMVKPNVIEREIPAFSVGRPDLNLPVLAVTI